MTSKLKRLLRPYLGPLRELRDFYRQRASHIPVAMGIGDGAVDAVVVHRDGVVAAEGWAKDMSAFTALTLRIDGVAIPPTHVFRVPRPDVEGLFGARGQFKGAVAEWVLDVSSRSQRVTLVVDRGREVSFDVPEFGSLAHVWLRNQPAVLHREHIYGFGPPVAQVSEQVLYLARALPPPILDFGCGAGALVRALRAEGLDAYGLELDEERIQVHLLPEARPYVTLYDGRLPVPLETGGFASIVSSEVLEHMPDPVAALAEMRRLATERLLLTVPDMSAIPRGFAHGVVPWHLLESTHVNFFTQESLERALAPYALRVETARLHQIACDRMRFYGNLAALVHLRPEAAPTVAS